MTVLQVLNEIAEVSSTNEKRALLFKYKDTPLLKEVLYAAKSPRINYYIQKIPDYQMIMAQNHNTLQEALEGVDIIAKREVTGNDAINFLKTVLATSSTSTAEIIKKIIGRNLKIGMGKTEINKVFPKLIEETPYMGAISYKKKAVLKLFAEEGELISDVKMDGRYANGTIEDNTVTIESRQGENNNIPGAAFMQELRNLSNCVLNGELTIPGIPRHESNGIIASIVSIEGKIAEGQPITNDMKKFVKEHSAYGYDDYKNMIVYTCWDILTLQEYAEQKSSTPYKERRENLAKVIKGLKNVRFIESRIVKSFAEAFAHFIELLEAGEEGTILKSLSAGWKDGKPTWQIKFKLEMDIDLRIKAFQWGTAGTKNEDVYSAVLAESDDGLIKTTVPGFTEEKMQYLTENPDKLRETVITVKCCGLSKAKNGTYHSLLHPTFQMFRDDKDTTDTLESALAIQKASASLKV